MAKPNYLYWAIGGVAAYMFLKPGGTVSPGNSTVTTVANGSVPAGVPTANVSAYPSDPNLLNPNYQLTPAQLRQYLANYTVLQQAMPQWVAESPEYGGDINKALQSHWTQYGCAGHMTFYPLTIPDKTPYVPPPKAPQSSGSWVSSALSIGASVIALLGVGNKYGFTNADVEIIINGSAVAKDLLPMFGNTEKTAAMNSLMNEILTDIT